MNSEHQFNTQIKLYHEFLGMGLIWLEDVESPQLDVMALTLVDFMRRELENEIIG